MGLELLGSLALLALVVGSLFGIGWVITEVIS